MKRPAHVRVGHLLYRVKVRSKKIYVRGKQANGYCHNQKQVIVLWSKLPLGFLADIFLHEVIHAMFCAYSWNNKLKEEDIATLLPGALLKFFMDNPEAIQWLYQCGEPSR